MWEIHTFTHGGLELIGIEVTVGQQRESIHCIVSVSETTETGFLDGHVQADILMGKLGQEMSWGQ